MRPLRMIGRVLFGLLCVAIAAMLVLVFLGGRMAGQRYSVPEDVLMTATTGDPEAIARGKHWSQILGCTDCHAADLGGSIMADVPPFRMVASNLTPGAGGVGASYGPKDWDRAIRYGVKPDGSAVLFVMPASLYHGMADADVADLVAYLQTLPAVDKALPKAGLKPLGKMIAGAGGLDPALAVSAPDRARAPAPPRGQRGATAEFGAYLASITCIECHGKDLRGAEHPDPDGPPGPSLEAAAGWSAEEFQLAVQHGVVPGGRVLDPQWMPWMSFVHMTADEVAAVRAYVQTRFR